MNASEPIPRRLIETILSLEVDDSSFSNVSLSAFSEDDLSSGMLG